MESGASSRELDQPQAMTYLRSRDCVAVMPSPVDNSPYTVLEALALRLPFVASRSGGAGELIHIDDLDRCTFDGWTTSDDVQPVEHAAEMPPFDHRSLADSYAELSRSLAGRQGSRWTRPKTKGPRQVACRGRRAAGIREPAGVGSHPRVSCASIHRDDARALATRSRASGSNRSARPGRRAGPRQHLEKRPADARGAGDRSAGGRSRGGSDHMRAPSSTTSRTSSLAICWCSCVPATVPTRSRRPAGRVGRSHAGGRILVPRSQQDCGRTSYRLR